MGEEQNAPLRIVATKDGVRVREAPVNGKPIGQANTDDILEVLEDAGAARAKIGTEGQWIQVRTPEGTTGYVAGQLMKLYGESAAPAAPPKTEPVREAPPAAPAISSDLLRVQPTSALNLREAGSTAAAILDRLSGYDILEVLETASTAQAKIGQKDQWLRVRKADGTEGFVVAQYVRAFSGAALVYPLGARNLTGMNLDRTHALGRPAPDLLKGIGWIRVKFNVSLDDSRAPDDPRRYGNTDIDAAFNRTKAFIEPYVRAGMKVCMVFTHQLFGEGAGYDWNAMGGRWDEFIPKYADFARRAAQKWLNTGLVHVYQVWNEQDTELGKGRAAVPIGARDYANMLAQTIRAIRSVDRTTPIITGGHTRGPGQGSDYARATIAALPGDVRPDGIASHPYGRGVRGNAYSNFGALQEELDAYLAALPGKALWFTEWGALGFQYNDSVCGAIADYAAGFMNIIKNQYVGKVAAAMWYAWADSMDDGYGLVDRSGKPRDPLYSRFLKF
ncbi:MAG: SH3 domain-containing protein [Chloroflexi bacterium]|nr:SH3 domain-containing protein [Chloroflexota bacterium]